MQQDICILAIDCATGPCSAAVLKGGQIAAYVEDLRPIVQSARLLPMIEETLTKAGINYSGLSGVACTVGPGSFTGIRIGLSAARGICFAAGIPGMGFTTLETMAYGLRHEHTKLFSVLNAGKGEWYCQAFAATPEWQAIKEPALVSPEIAESLSAHSMQWVGNLDIAGRNVIKTFPRADALAQLAAHSRSHLPLTPFYIRPPDITVPKTKK